MCPNQFLGAYKLEADMSWTPAQHIAKRKEEIDLLDNIFYAKKQSIHPICGTEPLIDAEGPVPTEGVAPPSEEGTTKTDYVMEEPLDI